MKRTRRMIARDLAISTLIEGIDTDDLVLLAEKFPKVLVQALQDLKASAVALEDSKPR
jgi:hypothetical protein